MIFMDLGSSYIYVLWEHNTKSDIDSQISYSIFVRKLAWFADLVYEKDFLWSSSPNDVQTTNKFWFEREFVVPPLGGLTYFKPVQGYEKGNALQIFVTLFVSQRSPKFSETV